MIVSKNNGQTMIEVLVALGAAVIIISSITVAVITSVNNTSYSTNQNKATQLAQEGLDIARGLRDSDYASFSQYSSTTPLTTCLAENSRTFEDSGACSNKPNAEQFIRTVRFQKQTNDTQTCGKDLVEVQSIVSWTDGKCVVSDTFCHSIKLVSCFSQTGVLPTP